MTQTEPESRATEEGNRGSEGGSAATESAGLPEASRSGRFARRRRVPWRVLGGVLLVVASIAASARFGLFGRAEDPREAEARVRRIVSELQLEGVHIERVREERLGTAARQATLADEHLWRGGVAPEVLEKLEQIGPFVLSLAQTGIDQPGLVRIAACPELVGLSLLGTSIDDDQLRALVPSPPDPPRLRLLSLERTAVSDAGLVHLAPLTSLRQLYLGGTRITDSGLGLLAGLTRLEAIKLGGTEVSDEGLPALARLPKLSFLSLDRTRITDAGVPVLASITTLEFLDVSQTWITEAGLKRLVAALPKCRVVK